MPDLTFRAATVADVPAIARARAADPEWGPADPRTAAYLEGRHDPQHALPPRRAFVCSDGGTVAGYIAGHLTRRYDCDGEVQYLWVAIDHRRRGVATRLFRLLARWFEDHDASRICVDVLPDNARARAFYARLGATELNPHWLVWDDIGEQPEIVIRAATRDDLPAIVRLLADDPLGARRESIDDGDAARYVAAFDEISEDPSNQLVVADLGDEVVGVLQLTLMPSLTYRGARRAQIEGVRVHAARRSSGIGRRLIRWAIDHARARGCRLLQLTTDRARAEVLSFYESAGFVCSHHGLKLDLTAPSRSEDGA